jgi:CheY-like chemotaxis protein
MLSDMKLKVLLAEDNAVNQLIISKLIENEGHSCIVANNGQEAVEKFKSEDFDFIIMDIEMPIMNGFEATKEIRKLEKTTRKHIPIIALSAHALIELMKEALDIGVDYYHTKPFRYEKIADTISEIQQNIYASLYSKTNEIEEEKNADTIFNLIPKTPNTNIKAKEKEKSDFSISMLYNKLNSDIDFFKVFTEKFIDTTTNLLEEIERAINLQDGNLLSKSSHSLKGTLSYIDAQKAVGLAIELEKRGKEQDFEYSDIILKKLRIENQKIIQNIIDFIMSNT